MRGLMLIGQGKVEMRELPTPKPGPGEALIRTTVLTPCNTDLEIVENLVFPDIVGHFIGHECVGVVEAVGEGVKDFRKGDRVCVPSITPTWNTLDPQDGCPAFKNNIGFAFEWGLTREGTFAEYVICNHADLNLALIPEGVSDIQAVLLCDMTTTAFQGIEDAQIKLGSTVVVFGCGPVGLSAVIAAVHKGAGCLFVVGAEEKGFELAKVYGATDCIDWRDGDVVEQILKRNGGTVDVTITAGGPPSCIVQALKLTRNGGSVCNVNAIYGDVVLTPDVWMNGLSQVNIKGWANVGGRRILERYLSMIAAGRFDPGLMVTHINHGIDSIEKTLWQKKERDVIKPVTVID